jgi:hypothetical protein
MTTPAWVLSSGDSSPQTLLRLSANALASLDGFRTTPLSSDPTELHQQALTFQQTLPNTQELVTLNPNVIQSGQELIDRLRSERNTARQERDEHMNGEARLQQKLADAELVMKRLATTPSSSEPSSRDRAEKIADPDKFDGTREKLKAFKDQLLLKTSGNPARFPNVQHKLRYAYQFLTGKAQRTMRIHLKRKVAADGEETYEVLFDSFAAFLKALDRHFGDPDEKHTAALALDKLRQTNQEFGAYYADFQELMDTLDHTDDTSRRHALTRGLSHEMQKALAIIPAPADESFDQYVKRLNELDCRLRALQSRAPQHRPPMNPATPSGSNGTTATGTAAGPMDLSAARGRISKAEKARRRAQGLCMYCGGTGHFAAECPARPAASKAANPAGGRRAITASAAVTSNAPTAPGHISDLDSDSDTDPETGKGGAQV